MQLTATDEQACPITTVSPEIALDICFFLTGAELDEVVAARKTASNTRANKIFVRIITGIGAVVLLFLLPSLRGGWHGLFMWNPPRALFYLALGVLDLWIAVGMPGGKKLNQLVNRLDVERHIRFSDRGVFVTHGSRTFDQEWSNFRFFQETPNLFLLQTVGTSFWTVPKRILSPSAAQELRAFLTAKLPQR